MLTVNLDKVLKDLDANTAGRTDYQIFMCITKHMNDEGVSVVPQRLLSEETGFMRHTVSNSVKRLAEKGFLTIERNITEQGGIATNIYHINHRYLLETKPVEHSQTKTRSRVQETQKTAPGCVNLEKALAELGSDGVNEKAKKIFTLIARHANQNGEARILLREITDATHISAKVVKNEIGFLIHNGFLTVSKEFVNTDTAHYYRNVYTIDSRFLGKRTPQDSACGKPSEYSGYFKVIPDYAGHDGCSYDSKTTLNPPSDMNEMRRLAQIGEVAADVLKNIFKLYEEKNK